MKLPGPTRQGRASYGCAKCVSSTSINRLTRCSAEDARPVPWAVSRDIDPVSDLSWHPSRTADQNACREDKSATEHDLECGAQERRFHVAVLYKGDDPQLDEDDHESYDGRGPE